MNNPKPQKRILLSICGMSPAVVTETLYALQKGDYGWPDEVHILTTIEGRKGIVNPRSTNGKDPVPGLPYQMEQLATDYGLPQIPFSIVENIHVITGADQRELDDARTIEDQEALGNYITRKVAQMCSDPDTQLHVSLAGGRKTMTFFAGYALSIFGRPEDVLSHVLVGDGFDQCPDFYYPTPYSKPVTPRGPTPGARDGVLDARDAVIQLALIPVIRQRHLYQEKLLEKIAQDNDNTLTYSHIVRLHNLAEQREQWCIAFDFPRRRVTICGETSLELKPTLFALYAMLSRFAKDGDKDICRPKRDKPDKALALYYLQELQRCADLPTEDCSDATKQLAAIWQNRDALFDRSLIEDKSLEQLTQQGVTAAFFSARLTELQKILEEHMPMPLVNVFMPQILYDKNGEPIEDGKRAKAGAYSMRLSPDRILGLVD